MTVPPQQFGADHYSALAFIEALCVDHKGTLDVRAHSRMRCNSDRHPAYAVMLGGFVRPPWRAEYGTRLANGLTFPEHDDWDCAYDMEAAGWIKINGTGAMPTFTMTEEGWKQAHALRKHRAAGNLCGTFKQV